MAKTCNQAHSWSRDENVGPTPSIYWTSCTILFECSTICSHLFSAMDCCMEYFASMAALITEWNISCNLFYVSLGHLTFWKSLRSRCPLKPMCSPALVRLSKNLLYFTLFSLYLDRHSRFQRWTPRPQHVFSQYLAPPHYLDVIETWELDLQLQQSGLEFETLIIIDLCLKYEKR